MYDLCIGGIAGIVSRTCTAPIELWKIQRQNSFMPHSTIRDVLQKEGIRGLWKGNGTNCLRIFPQLSINYDIYHRSKREMWEPLLKNRDIIHFCSGATGGLISITSVYPLETIRSRLSLQTRNNHYNGLYDAMRQMSFRDMYRGLNISILGFVPFNALNFLFYNRLKKEFMEQTRLHDSMIALCSGGFAGIFSLAITYPTDLIRRRMHIQGFDSHVPKYRSIPHAVKSIYFLDGYRGFYRGFIAGCIKIFPTIAIQFATMEALRNSSAASAASAASSSSS
jgi:solute carrier family 25 phosphate transporter 23/24/25/41